MNVSYDPGAGVTYVRLSVEAVAATIEVSDLLMVDIDAEHNPVGVEFLVGPERITETMVGRVVDLFPSLKALTELDRWLVTSRATAAVPSAH